MFCGGMNSVICSVFSEFVRGFGFWVWGFRWWLCWWFAGCMLRLVLGISDLAVLCGRVFWLASGFALVVFGFSFGVCVAGFVFRAVWAAMFRLGFGLVVGLCLSVLVGVVLM